MSDKTELLIVEVEKHPILSDEGRCDFKDAEKKKNAWKLIAQVNWGGRGFRHNWVVTRYVGSGIKGVGAGVRGVGSVGFGITALG